MPAKAGPKPQTQTPLPQCDSAVEFIELCTGPLYEWQRPIVADLAAEDRPRVAYVQVGRKNGKSRLAAALAIIELCTKQHRQIFLISDSERNLKSALWLEICTMVQTSPQLRNSVLIYKDHLECPETGSVLMLRPNNLSASQSINPHLVLFDEVHMQKTDQIWNGMQLAGAARMDGLLLGITSPGYDLTCMAHGLYQRVKANDTKLYGVVYEPSNPDADLDDQVALAEANPILIDRPELAEIFAEERDSLPEHDYRRFRMGQWTAGATAWFPYGVWDERATSRKLVEGEAVWIGFDGSLSGDSTALVACTADGFVQVLNAWENPGRKDWKVPRAEVEDAVAMAFEMYDVQALICDPPRWEQKVQEWDLRWPKRVVEFPTYVRARMVPACNTFATAVLEGTLTHDGDPRLARHVANCVVMQAPGGQYITKQDKNSPAKIDLAVAAVIAYQVARTTQKPARAAVWVM